MHEGVSGDGDVMVLHTDGIIEAANDQKELFDITRLARAIEELPDGTPEQIAERIFHRVSNSRRGEMTT